MPIRMVGRSAAFRISVDQIARIARAEAPVLIEGETGSGKELAARAVHYLGGRRDKPFIPVNCGAIPDGLIEAELFGYTKGAFTDARQARTGVIAQAHSGTLFLDEIDALSAKAQVTILRFLQDLRYRPLGASAEVSSNVRIVAASNRPLAELACDARFRSDLLFRLDILHVRLPPLRERGGDAELLAQHFVRVFCAKYGMTPKSLHADTIAWIGSYSWPGNVRELENVIHRELLMSDGDAIRYQGGRGAAQPGMDGRSDDAELRFQVAKAQAVEAFERGYLKRVLEKAQGNITRAARIAGKERRGFGKLLKKYCIVRDEYRDASTG